jgi:hypothetical protein
MSVCVCVRVRGACPEQRRIFQLVENKKMENIDYINEGLVVEPI